MPNPFSTPPLSGPAARQAMEALWNRTATTFRGAWGAGTGYDVGDLVTSSGSTYYRLVAGTTATAPGADPTNWTVWSAAASLASPLTGLSTASAANLVDTDSQLDAFGKLQGQFNSLRTAGLIVSNSSLAPPQWPGIDGSLGAGPIYTSHTRTGGYPEYGHWLNVLLVSAAVAAGQFDSGISSWVTSQNLIGGQNYGAWVGANTPSSSLGQTFTGGASIGLEVNSGNRWGDFGLQSDVGGTRYTVGLQIIPDIVPDSDGATLSVYPGSFGTVYGPSVHGHRWWVGSLVRYDTIMAAGYTHLANGGSTSPNAPTAFTKLGGYWIDGIDFSAAAFSGAALRLGSAPVVGGAFTPSSIAATGTVTGSNLSGVNTGNQTITLTGDVTGSGTGSFAATVANGAVSYAKMQNVSATSRILGRITAGAGSVEELTAANVKTLLSLTNVDNTSDANKPVSTAQAAADAAVLSTAQSYADGLVVGLLDDRGNFDASANTWPTTGGSGSAGVLKKGDLWTISVPGTLGGHAVTAGDVIRALVDAPGSTDANWAIAENNFGYVAENSTNKNASGGYAGLTLFKLNLVNAAGTVTSWLTNAATVARTWTMPDKDGTVAMTSDISGLTVTQGGTGVATLTTAYGLVAAGTTATGAVQTLAAGLTTQMLVGGGAAALPVWTAATGSGAPVRATTPTFSGAVTVVADASAFALKINGRAADSISVLASYQTDGATETSRLRTDSDGTWYLFTGPSTTERLRVNLTTGNLQVIQSVWALTGTAIPAGGTAGAGFMFSSTANFGVFFGSGAPSLSAAKGSLYLRSDGSSTSTRAYINTNGAGTWTNVTTAT
jgi:hypothetical protein